MSNWHLTLQFQLKFQLQSQWLCLLLVVTAPTVQSYLFYANSSVLQIMASLSVPVLEVPRMRSIFYDWGLQMNYNMPNKLKQFYNAPIWPDPDLWHSRHAKMWKRQLDSQASRTTVELTKHANDFTAREFYEGLEQILVRYGFDETCLQRSVCELAQHPFDVEHRNALTEILTFVLRPTLHQIFAGVDDLYSAPYRIAELRGTNFENCERLYAACESGILNLFTKVIW